jgi:ligand-binding sensor domain-containing protein
MVGTEPALRLRAGVQVQPFDTSSAEPRCLVQLPEGGRFQVSARLADVIRALQTEDSPAAVCARLEKVWGRPVTPAELTEIAGRFLRPYGLLADADATKQAAAPHGALWVRVPLLSPRLLSPFTRLGQHLFAGALVAAVLLVSLGIRWLIYRPGSPAFAFPGGDAFWVTLLSIIGVLCHELGHVSACRRFDCTHGAVGVGLYAIMPVFYSDVTAAWQLSRRQRMIVDAGGIYFQLLYALLLYGLYVITGWPAALAALLINDSAILLSLNPIFRFDGYWFFSDLIGVPNLRRRASDTLRFALRRLTQGRRVQRPDLLRLPAPVLVALGGYAIISNALMVYFFGRFLLLYAPAAVMHYPQLLREAWAALAAGLAQQDALRVIQAVAQPLIATLTLVTLPLMIWRGRRLLARPISALGHQFRWSNGGAIMVARNFGRSASRPARKLLLIAGAALASLVVIALALTALAPSLPPVQALGRLVVLPPEYGNWSNYVNADRVDALAWEGNRLWVGTQGGGVVAWDTVAGAYRQYLVNDGLASNDVYAVAVDGAGRKWFGTTAGVSRLDGQNWQTYTTASGLVDDYVLAALFDNAGRAWFGTLGGISVYDGSAWTTYTTTHGLADDMVWALLKDAAGRIWAGTERGVSVFDGATWTTYRRADGLVEDAVLSIGQGTDGVLWFGTRAGVSRFHGGVWTSYTTGNSGLANDWVLSIQVDRLGRVWFGTDGDAVSVFDGANWQNILPNTSTLGSMQVRAISLDAAGKLWFGTSGGLSPYDGAAWGNLLLTRGPANNNVNAAVADRSGALWLATEGGVTRVTRSGANLTWRSFIQRDGLPNVWVRGLAVDAANNVWAATAGGAAKFDGAGWDVFATGDGLASNDVLAVAVDSGGYKWFGTNGRGVSRLDDKGTTSHADDVWTTYTTTHGLAGDVVIALAAAPDGSVWFGAFGGGVSRLHGGVWVGTTRGAARFSGGVWTTYTSSDGLLGDNVGAIGFDSRGRVWLGSLTYGVQRLDDRGTLDKADDRWTDFTPANRLLLSQVRGLAVSADDSVWFGTYGSGLSRLELRPLFFPVIRKGS